MTKRSLLFASLLLLGGGGHDNAAASPQDQSLVRRIESGSDGFAGISFAGRPDACGSGYSLLRVGTSSFDSGNWSYSYADGAVGRCEPGIIRVLLRRVDRRVVAVRLGIGTVAWPDGTADLGSVSGRSAAAYLFDLAGRVDGRVGGDAVMAGALADSAETWSGLLELARNARLSRGLRESAASWLGRDGALSGPEAPAIASALMTLASDPDTPTGVRTRAVTALGRTGSAGTAGLERLSVGADPAVAKAAVTALGREPSDRARAVLERTAADQNRSQAVRLEAIKALGGRAATPADLARLRSLWPALGIKELRQAVIRAAGEAGGAANLKWLVTVAESGDEVSAVRAQAVKAAEQAGLGSSGLGRLYDGAADRSVRQAALEALARIGDRSARDKMGRIAESDTDPALRRAAIRRLAALGDQPMLEALESLVEPPR